MTIGPRVPSLKNGPIYFQLIKDGSHMQHNTSGFRGKMEVRSGDILANGLKKRKAL